MTEINTIPPVTEAMTGSPARSPDEGLKDLPSSSPEGQKVPFSEEETESNPVTIDALEKPLKQLNEFARIYQRSLQFSVDEVSNRTVITVINTETDEVIRQIPSEEVLLLARNLEREKSVILSVLA